MSENTRKDRFSEKMLATPPSGIRKFFDLLIGRDDIISLGVGEPDFLLLGLSEKKHIITLNKDTLPTHLTGDYKNFAKKLQNI